MYKMFRSQTESYQKDHSCHYVNLRTVQSLRWHMLNVGCTRKFLSRDVCQNVDDDCIPFKRQKSTRSYLPNDHIFVSYIVYQTYRPKQIETNINSLSETLWPTKSNLVFVFCKDLDLCLVVVLTGIMPHYQKAYIIVNK